MNNNAEAEQSEVEILKKKVAELSKRLNFALDCLDDCHGMDMYWAEFPEEEE